MSNRERWVIYPLLFMALAYGWKANTATELKLEKLVCGHLEADHAEAGRLDSKGPIVAAAVACTELAVNDRDGAKRIAMGTASKSETDPSPGRAGLIHVYGSGPKPVVVLGADDAGKSGQVATRLADGTAQVQVASNPSGGMVNIHRYEEGPSPLVLYVIDRREGPHVLGALFRHPPPSAPRADAAKDKKTEPK